MMFLIIPISFVMLLFFLIFLSLNCSVSLGQEFSIGDQIGTNKTITIGVTIVSSGGNFELGFFTPNNGSSYYIGTWYKNISPQTVIWVANRNLPLSFPEMANAEFAITNGNLVLLNGTKQLIWSTNIDSTKHNSVVAVLGNDGNLILRDSSNSTSRILWQSFDHPSHTFMPGSRTDYNKNTNSTRYITSWRSSEDPSPGPYTVEINPTNGQFRAMWNRTEEYWNSGSTWDGDSFSSVPYNIPNTTVNYTYVNDENEVFFFSPLVISRFVIDVTGQMTHFTWMDSSKQWNVFYVQPAQPCDVYAYCGEFGTCNSRLTSVCRCLPGFAPRLDTDWDLDIFSQGCVRKKKLSCGNSSATFKDRFRMISYVTLPKYYETVKVTSAAQCESTCFNNCSCTAYAYDGTECLTWTGELLNLQQLSQDDHRGRNLFIKVAASDFPSDDQAKKKKKQSWTRLKIIVLATISVTISLLVCCFIYSYCRRKVAKGKGQRNFFAHLQSRDNDLTNEDDDNNIDVVPFFSFESILVATNQFSKANMLGQGGFGPVYKGKFLGGREIAVKRLSTQSRQGIEEFTNEVLLIARVQHKNLVKLLGYCVKGRNEKILLYEYMLNKSLDTFIFDQQNRALLDWKKRFNIIVGIARGMSYLHHDSRLTIIHRDLKTSNILLDEGMNPKISDFGLARIVQGDYTLANTTKIAGTCGYMSPEYVLNGVFSTKSDVFSFGVIILEIVSGRRNTGFYQCEEAMNLIQYAWRLWTEEKAITMVDESLLETCNMDEAIKCINIGLLCVQEHPCQRPSMSNVILMLGGESMILPKPNPPAFVARTTISSKSATLYTKNGLTITIEQGR